MNDYPVEPGDNIDPSAFDADAFLSNSLLHDSEYTAELQSLHAEVRIAENHVMEVVENVGFSLSRIREVQARLAPDEPLSATTEQLSQICESHIANGNIRAATGANNIIVLMYAIQEIASLKQQSKMVDDEMQSQYKQEQQSSIYANEQLIPEHKAYFLTAVDILYPGIEGLAPGAPSTAASIQKYEEGYKTTIEIREKSRALRVQADYALRSTMAELGLGQHDQLDEAAATIIACITREHVVEAGNYDNELRENIKFASGITLRGEVHKKVTAMGWSERQYSAVLESVRASLLDPDSE